MAISKGILEYQKRFGKPTYDDRELFELLTVGVFQVGLNWKVAASKLPVFRTVFFNIDIAKVAAMDPENLETVLAVPAMIHNQRKIKAVIQNARAILKVQAEFGSFAKYMWKFVDDQPKIVEYENRGEIKNNTPFSIQVARDMKRQGFTFVGPTVTFLFMKAAGMIQDQVWDES